MLHSFLFPTWEHSLSCLSLSLSKCRGYETATCSQMSFVLRGPQASLVWQASQCSDVYVWDRSHSFMQPSSSHVWMWELDYKESWVPKNWYFWTVVLEKTLESLLVNKEIQPVHSKGNQSWIFIGRTDAEAETPVLGPPDAKRWLIGKDPDAGKDWRQEEKGMADDAMVGWHHRLNGHEFE